MKNREGWNIDEIATSTVYGRESDFEFSEEISGYHFISTRWNTQIFARHVNGPRHYYRY